jgi:hypothetical protein
MALTPWSTDINAGGDRVDANFKSFLLKSLRDAGELDEQDIQRAASLGVTDFRKHGKRVYGHPSTPCAVRVGDRYMNYPFWPIAKGVLTLDGYDTRRASRWCQVLIIFLLAPAQSSFSGHLLMRL